MAKRIVIVGAGHAGTNAARTLREQGWSEDILLITEEPCVPYERPPLSKSILTGEKLPGDIAIFPPGWTEQNEIGFRAGSRVEAIDRDAATVRLADGDVYRYDFLLLATGAGARSLTVPGAGLRGVFTLRSLDEANALRERLLPGKKLVVVGGGLIGLEVAAAAGVRGIDVTVLEREPVLLSRAIPSAIAEKVLELHRSHGTKIALKADVAAITGNHAVEGIRLTSGLELAADTVLISVGASPDVRLARGAGLATGDGILVNEYLQTSDDRIFAAGDAARFPLPTGGETVRLESWKNALDQGAAAALNMLGRSTPYRTVCWMWSDQFNKVVQVSGIPHPSRVEIRRQLDDGGLATFSVGACGALEAASAFGNLSQVAKLIRSATAIIDQRLCPSPSLLADPGYDLRKLLRSDATAAGQQHETRLSPAVQ